MLISRFDNTNIDNYILEFEVAIKRKLPGEYRSFLRKYNGGRTLETRFDIKEVSARLEGFYGLGNAEAAFKFFNLKDRGILKECLKDGMLPIAGTMRGNYVTLGIRFWNRGKIFFLYPGRQKEYKKLTNTLGDFIAGCKSERIEKVASIEEREQSMIAKGKENEITLALIKVWQQEIEYYSNIHQEELLLEELE